MTSVAEEMSDIMFFDTKYAWSWRLVAAWTILTKPELACAVIIQTADQRLKEFEDEQ